MLRSPETRTSVGVVGAFRLAWWHGKGIVLRCARNGAQRCEAGRLAGEDPGVVAVAGAARPLPDAMVFLLPHARWRRTLGPRAWPQWQILTRGPRR